MKKKISQKSFNKIIQSITGDTERYTVEERAIRFICWFIAMIFLIMGVPNNFIIGASIRVHIIAFLVSIIFFTYYYLIKAKILKVKDYWLIFIPMFALLTAIFLNEEGMRGPSPIFWILIVLIISIIEGTMKQMLLFSFAIINITGLFLLQWFKPDIISYYDSQNESLFNIYISMMSSVFLVYFLSWFTIKSHKKERNKVQEQKEIIQRQSNTLEHQTSELKTVNAELKKLNASKDKFFSIIAHDLRNPIGAVLGFSEMLIQNLGDLSKEKILKYSSSIYDSADHTYNLLENLLWWAQTQTKRIKIFPEKISLNALINQNILLLKEHAKKKEITFYISLEQEYNVFADKNMIDATIRNILSNAVKFTNSKGLIKISCELNVLNVRLIIEDNGVGMPENEIQNLFSIDKSISTEGTNGEPGTGLGLILCKEFIDANAGTISVMSKVNEGSVFIIELPIGDW